VSLATLGAALTPASAPARTPEERAQRGEERTLAREERSQRHEQRTRTREERVAQHAAQAGGGSCQLTIQLGAPRVTSGEAVEASGTLTCAEAPGAGEQLVTVFRSSHGAGEVEVGTAPTEADGAYALTIPALEENSIIGVSAAHARGAHVSVKVAPRITLTATPAGAEQANAGQHARARATFSGTVGPAEEGDRVALQSSFAAGGEHWRTIAHGRVDAQGEYSFTHTFSIAGERWVRVVAHPPHGNVPAASEPVAYDVPGPQNPALTIESSAPLSTFGQAITIGGVAEQAANASVQLLARTEGGPMQVVATAATDESGHYSFTAQPQQRTAYQVRDDAARSTTLWQQVSYELVQDAPPSGAKAGEALTFAGTVAPTPSGARVELEGEDASGFGFHAIAGAKVEGAEYSIAHTFASAGSYALRIRVTGAAGVTGVAGAPFTLEVAASS
jgi:hypothetical protein